MATHFSARMRTWIGSPAGVRKRGMDPGKQDRIAHFDLEIQVIAEEHLGVHDAAAEVVVVLARRRALGKLDVLGAHRDDHRGVPARGFPRTAR